MIDASTAEARERLTAALGCTRWVDAMAAHAPYDSLELIETGDALARTLTDAELDEAAAQRSPAGEDAGGDGTGVRRSAEERGGLKRTGEGVEAAVARGVDVYRRRFGREFVIREAGRGEQELQDELQRRLKSTPEEEAAEAKDELRQIAALRLKSLFADDA